MPAYILAGTIQAVSFTCLFAALSLIFPLLGIMSNAAVGLTTLSRSWRAGIIVAVIASIAFGGLSMFIQPNTMLGGLSGFLQWLPMVALASVLHRTIQWRWVFYVAIALGMVTIVLAHLFFPDAQSQWEKVLHKLWEQLLPDGDASQKTAVISYFAVKLNGIIIASTIALWLVSLMLARHWQAKITNPGGFGREFRELSLGRIPGILLLVSGGMSLLSEQIIWWEIMALMLVIMLFQGLAVLHSVRHQLDLHVAFLFGIYAAGVMFAPEWIIIMSIIGLIDNVYSIRKAISAKAKT